jgi:hypothetical protein
MLHGVDGVHLAFAAACQLGFLSKSTVSAMTKRSRHLVSGLNSEPYRVLKGWLKLFLRLPNKNLNQAAFCCFFHLAQRALCAARMLASPAAEILRLVRIGIGAFKRTGFAPLSLALLARCAAAILARAAGDTRRPCLCKTLLTPSRLPRAAKAASNFSTSLCARSLSLLNCRITPARLTIVPSRARIVAKEVTCRRSSRNAFQLNASGAAALVAVVLRAGCMAASVADERAIDVKHHRPELISGNTVGTADKVFHVRTPWLGWEFLHGVARRNLG